MVFLILHKSGNYWSFPKGHKEEGETPRQTAIRELKEETGLDVVEFLPCKPFSEEYSFMREGVKVHKKVEYFLAFVSKDVSLQKKEILDGKWFTIEQAVQVMTFPQSRSLCEKLLEPEILATIQNH